MIRLAPRTPGPARRPSGRAVLEAIGRDGDADRLARAMSDHADMVFATCRRVLGNDAEAAEVTQETFFQFLRNAGRIQGSIGAWLHRAATGRAIDVIRSNAARRRREEAYATGVSGDGDTAWREVEPLVDEALAMLPANERDLLVAHYLMRRTVADIGRSLGISQPTASRRLAAALDALRSRLRELGLETGPAVLEPLSTCPMPTAPDEVLLALGKMALAHSAAVPAEAGIATAKKAGTALILLLATGSAFLAFRPAKRPTAPAMAAPPAAAPSSTSYGFATSVVWTATPGGPIRVSRRGVHFTVTNRIASEIVRPAP